MAWCCHSWRSPSATSKRQGRRPSRSDRQSLRRLVWPMKSDSESASSPRPHPCTPWTRSYVKAFQCNRLRFVHNYLFHSCSSVNYIVSQKRMHGHKVKQDLQSYEIIAFLSTFFNYTRFQAYQDFRSENIWDFWRWISGRRCPMVSSSGTQWLLSYIICESGAASTPCALESNP
jgi:hypothetical protein